MRAMDSSPLVQHLPTSWWPWPAIAARPYELVNGVRSSIEYRKNVGVVTAVVYLAIRAVGELIRNRNKKRKKFNNSRNIAVLSSCVSSFDPHSFE